MKKHWWDSQPFPTELGWQREIRTAPPRKSLYRDRFVIACTTPYSAVSAEGLGLHPDTWERLSLAIRIEHESMHYLTRRVFGSMKSRLLDELIADYAGIVHASGRFRADWALRFLGLEGYPEYRAGGRLEHYRGDPPLSDGAFRVLCGLAQRAVGNRRPGPRPPRRRDAAGRPLRDVLALTRLTVEDLRRPRRRGPPAYGGAGRRALPSAHAAAAARGTVAAVRLTPALRPRISLWTHARDTGSRAKDAHSG